MVRVHGFVWRGQSVIDCMSLYKLSLTSIVFVMDMDDLWTLLGNTVNPTIKEHHIKLKF